MNEEKITQADVEWMKTTWMAFGGWPEMLRKWAKGHKKEFGIVDYTGCLMAVDHASFSDKGRVYRLRPDYVLPVEVPEGWRIVTDQERLEFDCPQQGKLLFNNKSRSRTWEEAEGVCWKNTTADITYATALDYVFKKPKENKIKFVEYPVSINIDDEYICDVEHKEDILLLYALPRIKGFAGVQFDGQKSGEWSMLINKFIDAEGELHCISFIGGKPAVPVRARFYVEEN